MVHCCESGGPSRRLRGLRIVPDSSGYFEVSYRVGAGIEMHLRIGSRCSFVFCLPSLQKLGGIFAGVFKGERRMIRPPKLGRRKTVSQRLTERAGMTARKKEKNQTNSHRIPSSRCCISDALYHERLARLVR